MKSPVIKTGTECWKVFAAVVCREGGESAVISIIMIINNVIVINVIIDAVSSRSSFSGISSFSSIEGEALKLFLLL